MNISALLSAILIFLTAQDLSVGITFPAAGAVLRGDVKITGTTDVPNFASAKLEFRYSSDPGETWFPLQSFTQPTTDSSIYVWNTSLITDGDYVLRLRATSADGIYQEVTVPVSIRNDAPASTPTPIPTSTLESGISIGAPTPFLLAASPTPTEIPRPTPTALPANPASLKKTDVYATLGRGALVIIGLFILARVALRLSRS